MGNPSANCRGIFGGRQVKARAICDSAVRARTSFWTGSGSHQERTDRDWAEPHWARWISSNATEAGPTAHEPSLSSTCRLTQPQFGSAGRGGDQTARWASRTTTSINPASRIELDSSDDIGESAGKSRVWWATSGIEPLNRGLADLTPPLSRPVSHSAPRAPRGILSVRSTVSVTARIRRTLPVTTPCPDYRPAEETARGRAEGSPSPPRP
jgi:hypothetical protein